MSADDSDSDSASVENSPTNASERTPLLASGAVLAATAASVHGMCGLFYVSFILSEVTADNTDCVY